MKIILFGLSFFCLLIFNSSFGQTTAPALPHNSTGSDLTLDGSFKFQYQQNEYYIELNRENETYRELDANGTVVGTGIFKRGDNWIKAAPIQVYDGALLRKELVGTINSRSPEKIILDVEVNGVSAQLELHPH